MRANRAAFDRWPIVPRMLPGEPQPRPPADPAGRRPCRRRCCSPRSGPPAWSTRDSDLHIARAAAAGRGCPTSSPTRAVPRWRTVAAAMGDAPRWFQLYWSRRRGPRRQPDPAGPRRSAPERSSSPWTPPCSAGGRRTSTSARCRSRRASGIAQYTSDPRFREIVAERIARAGRPAGPRTSRSPLGAIRSLLSITRNHPGTAAGQPALAGAAGVGRDLPRHLLQPGTELGPPGDPAGPHRLPVVLKGILHPDDARRAFEARRRRHRGVQPRRAAGRQRDRLARRAARRPRGRGPDPTVLLDSGVRTGADVFTALALGADAVLLGRPYIYGLAMAGSAASRR